MANLDLLARVRVRHLSGQVAFAKLDVSVPGKLELFNCRLRSHSVYSYIS